MSEATPTAAGCTRHTFSFADYHDPPWMGFRSLRVMNDDTIAPGRRFGTHPHRDMKIVTLVLSGALEQKDSMGNGRVIRSGEVQYMAAGSGVEHSKFNPSPTEPVLLVQIWILPDKKGAKPNYAEKSFTVATEGHLNLVTSKTGRDGSNAINQNADLFVAKLDASGTVSYALRPNRHGWVQVLAGDVVVNGESLIPGHGAALSGESVVKIASARPLQVLLFDLI